MQDHVVGSAIRLLRQRRDWRQVDLALRAKTSRGSVSRAERGLLRELTTDTLRRIVEALGGRLDVALRWQGGDLDRLINARHSAMHEVVSARLEQIGGWETTPEVSFSIYGERGVIDILAWHPERALALVVELKTELVDMQELVGTADRKRRLARDVCGQRGWEPRTVGLVVLVADSQRNRRLARAHISFIRAAYPDSNRDVLAWLAAPTEPIRALAWLTAEWRSNARHRGTRPDLAARRRVNRQRRES